MSQPKSSIAIVLVNLGTPAAPTAKAVRDYLRQFLSDPRVIDAPKWLWWFILRGVILPFRPRKVAHSYQQVWLEEGSPLRVYSQRLADSLQATLQSQHGPVVRVYSTMTYGEPALSACLAELKQQRVERVLIIPQYPQYSVSTTAAVYDCVADVCRRQTCVPELRFVRDYYAHPRYIAALAESVQQHWQTRGRGEKLIFSFHGIPQRYVDKGDPYAEQCRHTATQVAEKLGLSREQWQLAFQSRFGPAQWLQPYMIELMDQLPQQGVRSIDVISPGFAADCLETLEELKMQNRDAFCAAGGEQFHYIAALNDQPRHVELLTELVNQHIQGWEN